ncbi:hypothetical protein FPQ18DRAFT_354975 [Pyronema domesticum]|uniref:Uncharacterized protein n=1 Tax=Pyronema omphalodes (strain CBS 100304) TaxID=1076935 RepID=U4LM14_PYROM|nr:hypothetical protein FPQ18DRAFT_354975 [Pyronema domesticum]CCX33184.1 Protein of unknown function [Pyronema omphalodes CBS 100304]
MPDTAQDIAPHCPTSQKANIISESKQSPVSRKNSALSLDLAFVAGVASLILKVRNIFRRKKKAVDYTDLSNSTSGPQSPATTTIVPLNPPKLLEKPPSTSAPPNMSQPVPRYSIEQNSDAQKASSLYGTPRPIPAKGPQETVHITGISEYTNSSEKARYYRTTEAFRRQIILAARKQKIPLTIDLYKNSEEKGSGPVVVIYGAGSYGLKNDVKKALESELLTYDVYLYENPDRWRQISV